LAVTCRWEESPEYESVLNSLVQSERAFAQAAADLGTRAAFLAYLADDAILFRPRALDGRQFLQAQPDSPGLLSWEPVYADVSAAGDLGYTTGPWSYKPDPSGDPAAHGQYFSVWKKLPDGSWKVVVDHGITNPPPLEPAGPLRTPQLPRADRRRAGREIEPGSELQRVLNKDRAFAAAAESQGALQSVNAFVTADVYLLRNDIDPRTGIEEARVLAAERPGKLNWSVLGGEVARSGDLAFTYGEYEYSPPRADAPSELGNYVRVWRNSPSTGGIWRVAVDLMNPVPLAPEAKQD
jgi:ketosteroid isomerase-like protein